MVVLPLDPSLAGSDLLDQIGRRVPHIVALLRGCFLPRECLDLRLQWHGDSFKNLQVLQLFVNGCDSLVGESNDVLNEVKPDLSFRLQPNFGFSVQLGFLRWRTGAAWRDVWAGAHGTPAFFVSRLSDRVPVPVARPTLWTHHWNSCWIPAGPPVAAAET